MVLQSITVTGPGAASCPHPGAGDAPHGLVTVAPGGYLRLEGCKVVMPAQSAPHCPAVLVRGPNARASLVQCEVSGSSSDGVCVMGAGAAATVLESKSEHNGTCGFAVRGQGRMLVNGSCESSHNGHTGFAAFGLGSVLFVRDRCLALENGVRLAVEQALAEPSPLPLASEVGAGFAAIDGVVAVGDGCIAHSSVYGFVACGPRASFAAGASSLAEKCSHGGFVVQAGGRMSLGTCGMARDCTGSGFLASGVGSHLAVSEGSSADSRSPKLDVIRNGFAALDGGHVSTGPGCTAICCSNGFMAWADGSLLEAGDGSKSNDCAIGFSAVDRAETVAAPSCTASSGAVGFMALAAHVTAGSRCQVTSCDFVGFQALKGGRLDAGAGCSASKMRTGFCACDTGSQLLVAADACACDCSDNGYAAADGAVMLLGPNCSSERTCIAMYAHGNGARLTAGTGLRLSGNTHDSLGTHGGEVVLEDEVQAAAEAAATAAAAAAEAATQQARADAAAAAVNAAADAAAQALMDQEAKDKAKEERKVSRALLHAWIAILRLRLCAGSMGNKAWGRR